MSEAREHAEKHGCDHLAALTDPSYSDDSHHVRCRYCSRLATERLGDIAFGCRCQTNPNRARQTSNPPLIRRRRLAWSY